ncbi:MULTISPECIES: GerAB/ArcD/ProY family transporter [unclassified Bacillus (in: firmicutes)]|uniref:GerAB/ArcD/ProY family transporter n=1 Tax=unclassified Bacillus (in: firmicutes) TaxID=185979 RepID=UPI000BF07919|nr:MULTISPECIES: GerAB/ArcD/ProY family transporter [unclassified Bacillus (in: firmicutes)]PEJ56303.1 spore gernimation protein [Bacillus sp. AFS002410]PEL10486.1 spore gernimation protein [Bacillus sp. AFS017336]
MNSEPIDRISTNQVVMLMVNFIFGAGILILPRTITDKVKTPDGWISVVISGLLILLLVFLLVMLCKQYPNETYYQFTQKIIGKYLGIPLGIIIIIYYTCLSALEVRLMSETTRLFLLQGTPSWAILIPFLWIGLYIVLGGINPIARILELIFPITVFFFLLVIFLGIEIIDIDNLRPVLGNGFKPVLNGLKTTSLSFSGFEVVLFIYMFMKDKKKISKAIIYGIGIPFVFYSITVVAVVGAFSVDGVLLQTWPVLTYIRSYDIQGLIVERFDSLLLVIWIMQIFATYIIAFYIGSLGMAQIFNKKNIKPFMFGTLPFIYIIAMIPKDINQTLKMADAIGNTAFYLYGIIPLLLLVISFVRKKFNENM